MVSGSLDGGEPNAEYLLAKMPHNFVVTPLVQSRSSKTNLSCNYSILKTIAAIIQIIYGSFELYQSRGRQIARFGYAAYSLTVIPYIIMSLMNLLATFAEP